MVEYSETVPEKKLMNGGAYCSVISTC